MQTLHIALRAIPGAVRRYCRRGRRPEHSLAVRAFVAGAVISTAPSSLFAPFPARFDAAAAGDGGQSICGVAA